MKKVMIFALALMLSSCKLFKSTSSYPVPDYYKIESSEGVVYEVKTVFNGFSVDLATGNNTIFFNNYKVTPVYVYGKTND